MKTAHYERIPANQKTLNCKELSFEFFLKKNYQEDLNKALIDRKLLSSSTKSVIIQRPRLEWINRARSSLNKSIKNWNNNQYPAFYIFNDEEVVPMAKKYFNTINSMLDPEIVVDKSASKNLETVSSWIKTYESYNADLNSLLEERITLQFNLSLLKKLKLKKDEQDILISLKKNGEWVNEIIPLRKADKDLSFQINNFSASLKDFDGTLFTNGKIKDRVIRQAMLFDVLTILQREFERSLKNTANPHSELLMEMDKINKLLKEAALQPTTYGVYRMTNKIFIRELASLAKIDLAYKTFLQNPLLKFNEIINAFIQNRAVNLQGKKPVKKPGIFSRIYAKISNITLKEAGLAGGSVVVGGIGIERYFAIKPSLSTSENTPAHEEQLQRTNEQIEQESSEHSRVVEVKIEEIN